jgi:cellulose synthase operon protein C
LKVSITTEGMCEAKSRDGQKELFTTRLIVSYDASLLSRVMRLWILVVGYFAVFTANVMCAEDSLQRPAPLVKEEASTESPGTHVADVLAARRAQEMGFPSAAIAVYRRLLSQPGGDRAALVLGLATSLLEEGRTAEARDVLETYPGPRLSPWLLRVALAAAQERNFAAAKEALGPMHEEELSPAEMSWLRYLQGLVMEADGDHDRANYAFNEAAERAASSQARAGFLLKRDQSRLRSGAPVTEEQLETARRNFEQYQGRKLGYGFARTYAVMLHHLNRKAEAIEVLQRQLAALPAEERTELDDTRLLLGLIAGAEGGAGRNALEQLLQRGVDVDKQRIALQLLAQASTRPPLRTAFRRLLGELINAPVAHPILEDVLLFRAQVSLAVARADNTSDGYALAEDDARMLLQKFPGSPLKAHAFSVLTDAAWEQARYRTAADLAVKARAELPPGQERAALGVLIAEAWFRAQDFRSAADAYAAALSEPPAGIPRGSLIFQRVLAEIETGELERAATVLDQLSRDPSFDVVNRWRAEWNLARALQVQSKTTEAFERVTRLLSGSEGASAALPAELRARMAWLQVRLSEATGNAERTIQLIDALAGSLRGVGPELTKEIAGWGELLRASANFALGRDAAALEVLKKLRVDFPRSDAAVYSYFDEAEYYAKQDKTAEAQHLLTKLADDFPDNAYAPLALFKAALQAERRGQDTNLAEANGYIEDLVIKYPHSPLVFPARLKQGDLLRKLNQFPQAQRAYEELVNKYPHREDVVLAQLALAETHNAQSTNEPSHAESALVLFEHVRDRVDAPVDARVEAGFNIGLLHFRRNELSLAEEMWWRNVVHEFLLQPKQAAQLGPKGRYWVTRTLLELGMLYEQQGKLEQAKRSWLLILDSKLGYGESVARSRLARFNLAEFKQ